MPDGRQGRGRGRARRAEEGARGHDTDGDQGGHREGRARSARRWARPCTPQAQAAQAAARRGAGRTTAAADAAEDDDVVDAEIVDEDRAEGRASQVTGSATGASTATSRTPPGSAHGSRSPTPAQRPARTGAARRPARRAGPAGARRRATGDPTAARPTASADDASSDQAAPQLAERTADLQRVQAEYANYRKRVERDRAAVARAGGRPTSLTELLPVLDDIGRAREHGELVGGFKSVAESLEAAVDQAGPGAVRRGGRAVRPEGARGADALVLRPT